MTKQELRLKCLLGVDSLHVSDMLEHAFEEDDWTRSRLDALAFGQLFSDDNDHNLREAWSHYCNYHRELAQYEPANAIP
jgi:hypothetical protein